eukprot:jgi/Mesvir1/17590/Mv08822-RA.1
MATQSAEELTLEQLLAFPGVGAQVMSWLPVPERVKLRRTCRTFLSATDESLLALTQLFGDDAAGQGVRPGMNGMPWLLAKCPNLTTLSLASRTDHGAPWQERERLSLYLPWVEHDKMAAGLLSLEGIAHRYQGLTELNVAGCRDVSDAGLVALARYCPGLQALDVSGCREVGDTGVAAVAQSVVGLRRLAISYCERVSDASAARLGQHCRQLAEAHVDRTGVTDAGVNALVHGCPGLRTLVVPLCVTDACMTQVAARCPLLEHLGVELCGGVSDASVKRIAAGCPLLTRLDAAYCDKIGDAGLGELVKMTCGRWPGLRHVNVMMTSVTDAGVAAIAMCCRELRYLDVGKCQKVSNEGIAVVARNCPHLRYLSVTYCPLVTDAGICQVAEACRAMQELDISSSGVKDEGVRSIGAHCHELKRLKMSCCRIDGSTLAALADGCRQLELLDVSMSGCVTKESVAALSDHCAQLRVFRAWGNRFTDEDVSQLIQKGGRRLVALTLCNTYITDVTVTSVGQHCLWLRELHVANCRGVTDEGIRVIAANCKGLRQLDVEGCEVTSSSFSSLERDGCVVATRTW